MQKTSIIILISILTILFIPHSFCLSATLHVPQEYTTINEAMMEAEWGDSVLVSPGYYIERVRMWPGIILVSTDGPDSTIIHGGDNECTVELANYAIVRGFHIKGSRSGNGYWGGVRAQYCSGIIDRNLITETGHNGICGYTFTGIIKNNTIVNNYRAGIWVGFDANCLMVNNIVAINDQDFGIGAWDSNPQIIYTCCWNNEGVNYWGMAEPGTGCFEVDPDFISGTTGNYHLQQTSPCIDTGSPAYCDMDGTRSDMGCFSTDQHTNVELEASLSAVNPPILIPAEGGYFDYTYEIHNSNLFTVYFELWFDVLLPGGIIYGPVSAQKGLSVPPGESILGENSQYVPPGAPQGEYLFYLQAGCFSFDEIFGEDSFTFEKEGVLLSGDQSWFDNKGEADANHCKPVKFDNTAEYFDGSGIIQGRIPAKTGTISIICSPTPFNQSSVIHYRLTAAGHVNLRIYDVAGRLADELADENQAAGPQSISFEARDLSSGIYFAMLKVDGEGSGVTKMVLLK